MADTQAQTYRGGTIKYADFSGLRNDVSPERFTQSDLAVGNNVDIDKSGRVARRNGYTKVLSGAYHSLWSGRQGCMVVQGGVLKKIGSGYSLTALRTMIDAAAKVSYAEANDSVYFSNGVDKGIVSGGVARSWGIAVPAAPSVFPSVGNMPAGTYQYTMTYTRVDGQESGAALAGRVDVSDGGGLIFGLSVSSDPGVVSKTVYLSTPNGVVLYAAIQVANAVTSATYTNNAQELTLPLITQFLSPPPAGHMVAYYRGRLYIAVDNTIYPSEPFAYELFDLRKGIYLDGRVTLMAAFEVEDAAQSGFFIGTDKSCGVLIGSNEFAYTQKTDYGAIEGAVTFVDGSLVKDGATNTGNLPIWVTAQGVCIGMPQMEIVNVTRSRYMFDGAGKGAAVFLPDESRFVATTIF